MGVLKVNGVLEAERVRCRRSSPAPQCSVCAGKGQRDVQSAVVLFVTGKRGGAAWEVYFRDAFLDNAYDGKDKPSKAKRSNYSGWVTAEGAGTPVTCSCPRDRVPSPGLVVCPQEGQGWALLEPTGPAALFHGRPELQSGSNTGLAHLGWVLKRQVSILYQSCWLV